MTKNALTRAIARRVNEEQYTGGRLAAIGNAGHPATLAEIVIDVLTERSVIDSDGQKQCTLDLPVSGVP